MSFMKINNHIVNLEQIAYVINIEENRKLLDYSFKTGLRLTQSFATEEEAMFVLNELWEKLLKIDTSSVDITPKIIKQGFKTLTQIKKEEEEQELQRMIELEEKENNND